MFNSKNAKIEKVDTIVGEGTVFEGDIKATGIVRVDGTLQGELETQGDVIVGEKGKVEGRVKGRNITVAGKIEGDVMSEGKLHLLSTGLIYGDLDINTLIVDEGSQFEGHCSMNANQDKNNRNKNQKNYQKNNKNQDQQQKEKDKDKDKDK